MILNHRIKTVITVCYLIVVHILLVLAIANNNLFNKCLEKIGLKDNKRFVTEFCYNTTASFYEQVDKHVPNGSVIFIGDSITQGLCTSAVSPLSVNWGLGNDTTYGLLKRISKYDSLSRAAVVVIEIGINDIINGCSDKEIVHNYKKILQYFPSKLGIVCSSILPVDEKVLVGNLSNNLNNSRITYLNKELAKVCDERNGCFWTNSNGLADNFGNLAANFHKGDGLHLNSYGYVVWIRELKQRIYDAERWSNSPSQ